MIPYKNRHKEAQKAQKFFAEVFVLFVLLCGFQLPGIKAQMIYPMRKHDIGDQEATLHLFRTMRDFWKRNL